MRIGALQASLLLTRRWVEGSGVVIDHSLGRLRQKSSPFCFCFLLLLVLVGQPVSVVFPVPIFFDVGDGSVPVVC